MEIKSSELFDKSILQVRTPSSLDSEVLSKMEDKKLREVSDQFESFFLNQILETSLKTSNIAGESTGSDIIKSMYLQSIADNSSGTFGISDMLYKFLSENNKKE